jgi:hypothetical protein
MVSYIVEYGGAPEVGEEDDHAAHVKGTNKVLTG